MKINTVNHFIGDAFTSLKRNRTISIASVITVLITFFVLGVFLLLAKNASLAINDVEAKVELKVFLVKDVTLLDKREIEVKLRQQEGVKDIQYESEEDAFNNFKESMSEAEGLLKGYSLENNPLPAAYVIKLEDPSYAESVAKSVEGLPGVDSVGNQQNLINTVSSIVKGVRFVGGILFVILIGVSVFLIMNTTKLTVYSRRREVGIMKFVGATDWFIRWPFIIEGVIIGILGALFSIIILFFLYKAVFAYIVTKMLMVNLVAPSYVFSTLLWQFLLGGVFVGGIASYASLRKFLIV